MSAEAASERPTLKNPVTVTIDGRAITAEAGSTLLQVALDHGVEIPHYCYHPKLSIDGSCRMCQVKIEKAPKLAISCNTPITDGMVVDTQAPEVVKARKGVMELLLINHPLDCPICDQAGECFLQDYSFGHGRGDARTSTPRRKGLKRHPIGPRVLFDQERCILCRRCVRFTTEVTKTNELRVLGIGDTSHIGAFPGKPLDNDYSINTADICPVGALLSSDFHHKLRVWFLTDVESVCPSCSNGCNVKLGVYRNQIWRMVPRRNDAVNETWMCDHGRLNFKFAQDQSRVRTNAVRTVARGGALAGSNGSVISPAAPGTEGSSLYETSLELAVESAAELIRSIAKQHGAGSIGIVGSPHLTNEESHQLVQLAAKGIGTPHLDLVVVLGSSDDILIKAEKAANARGSREVGVKPGADGLDAPSMLRAATDGTLKLLIVVGSADLCTVAGEEAIESAVAKLDGLIVIDANRSPLTDRASVVLAGATWAEKDGTFTNHAGRVQRIRKALELPEGMVTDGQLFGRLEAAIAGRANAPEFDPRSTFDELAKSVPSYTAMRFDAIGSRGRAAAPLGTDPSTSAGQE